MISGRFTALGGLLVASALAAVAALSGGGSSPPARPLPTVAAVGLAGYSGVW